MGVADRYEKRKMHEEIANTTSGGVEYRRKVKNAQAVSEQISSRLSSLEKYNSDFFNSYKSRYFDKDDKYIDTYRADHQDWFSTVQSQKDAYDKEASYIKSLLDEYKGFLDKDAVSSVYEALDTNGKNLSDILSNAKTEVDIFSKYKTADEYQEAVQASKEYESKTTADLGVLGAEISELEKLKGMYNKADVGSAMYGTPDAQTNWNNLTGERATAGNTTPNNPFGNTPSGVKQALDSVGGTKGEPTNPKEDLAKFGWNYINPSEYSPETIDEVIAEKRAYYNHAEYIQNGIKMASVADSESDLYDPEFELYAQKGKDLGGGQPWHFFGTYMGDNEVEDVRNYYDDHEMSSGRSNRNNVILAMTEEEVSIYNYYLGKYGKEKAESYLGYLESTLNDRYATHLHEEADTKIESLFFAGVAGLDQFATGIKNLANTSDNYIPPSPYQQASAMIREDIVEDGKGWGVAYDVINTTANMAPSIITSAALSYVNPVLGQAAGAVLMGASAAGHAYAEAINLGYTKDQARSYSTLVGASEAGLQYVLGGVGKLGGSATKGLVSKLATKFASGVDNAFAKIAITSGTKLVGSMISEFGEEYLQEVLTPVFKNIALDTNEEVKLFSTDALYAGFLGALSAALLEGGSIFSGEIGTYKAGKSVIEKGQVDALAKLGASFSADSVAHKIASKVNEKTDAYTLGQLLREVGADHLSAENIADITAELERKGMSLSDAQSIAKWLNKAVEGEYFTKGQISALENNEIISDVFRDVILNKNSSVNQRNQEYQAILRSLEQAEIDTKAPSEKLSVLDETAPTTETASATSAVPYSSEYISSVAKVYEEMGMPAEQAKNMAMAQLSQSNPNTSSSTDKNPTESKYEVSDDGKTINLKTDKEVNISKIDSISESGEANLTLDDGMVVKASDVAFGSPVERALIEGIGDIKIGKSHISTDSANALYQAAMTEWKSNPNMTAGEAVSLVKGLAESYVYGAYNFGEERLTATDENGKTKYFAGELSQTQRKFAYELGTKDSIAKAEADQKVIDDIKAKADPKAKNKHLGKVIFEGDIAVDELGLTDTQKANLDGIKLLADTSNIEFHVFMSDENLKFTLPDGAVRSANGWYVSGTNEIWIDLKAGNFGQGTMLWTAGHEISHYIKQWSPAQWKAMADLIFDTFAKNDVNIESMMNKQKAKIRKRYNKKNMPSEAKLTDMAYEEFVSDALTNMLTDGSIVNFIAEVKQKNKSLAKKILDAIKNLLSKWGLIIDDYKGRSLEVEEAQALSQFEDTFKKLQEMYREALMDADETVATIGARNLADFAEAKNTNGESLFQYRAMEADEDIYRDMLSKWGKMTDTQIDNLFTTIDRAMDVIKDNLEILDYAWESDIDDRAFSPVKPNSDSLYQVSLDFSTLCRKRILQQTIQAHLQEALNQPLSREEGIAIRDALIALQEEGRQIEVACALCYVESARMKSPAQIKKFLSNRESVLKEFFAGKSVGSMKTKIKQAEVDAREQLHKKNPSGIKGKDGSMLDSRTASLKSMPNKYADEIRLAKKAAKEAYKPTAEEQKLIDVAKGMSISDFTSPEGLENLAKNYPRLFDAYTSYIRNATKSKGIEGDTWWRAGDSKKIGDVLIANMNKENGLRSQSWSDFQVIHILDYIAATIELSTRNAKEQAYSKVPDYVELMGQTGVMINMSLIPTREFNGKLDYDSVEGMAYKRALELREKYPATAGTICIGIDNKQIQMLLADITIDYVIPYHKSGMAASIRKLMHIPTWEQYEDYQSEDNLSREKAEAQAKKYGVKLLAESDPNYHKHTSFSEWFDLEVAKQIAKIENANPTDKAKQKKYGVMYGGYMAMQNAANEYLKLCAERGVAPKFSHENADFTTEDNYWKLLIDRKMVNNATGEIIEQQTIKPVFDEGEVLRILNDELERYPSVKADQEYATRKVTEKFLSGEIKSGMSAEAIAKVMKTPVDNIAKTNIVESFGEFNKPRRLTELDLSDYLKAGTRPNKAKQQALNEGKKIILTNEDEITDYISASIKGAKNLTTVAYGRVTDRLAADVAEYSNGDIVIDDNFLELVSYDIDHAYREHLKAKQEGDIDLKLEDFENIPEYIDTYDDLVYAIKFKSGNTKICLSKKLANGRVLLIETVSKSRGSVEFKNMIGVSNEKYANEYEKVYKKGNSSNTRGSKSSNISLHDETVSDDSITDFSDSVKMLSDRDSAYLDAVNRGDMETAQRMVDDVAKKAGAILDESGNPLKLYRGTKGGQTVFAKENTLNGKIYTIDNINIATKYGDKSGKATEISNQVEGEPTTYALYGFPKKMLTLDAQYGVWSDLLIPEELLKYSDGRYKATNAEIAEWAETEGYDALRIDNVRDGSFDAGSEIIFFDENLVKSADAITKDNNGNIIPLSEKFNDAKTDIRYSLRDVDPVEPTSNKWQRTLTTSEVKAKFPDLWDVSADESEVRNPTQISGTVRSYRKVYDFLKKTNFKGTILDASSGLGYGTKAGIEEYGFDVEDIEPYPDKSYSPKYTDYSSLDKKYDVIISNAVLNVLPQDQRDALVVKMGELLKDGGRMFINVRGDDVKNASSKIAINEGLMEYYISKSGSYQKGFTKSELVAYLQDALGDGFSVTPTTFFGKTSAVVTKNEGQVMFSERDTSTSNRTILANSLESAAQNDIERNKLAQYKEKISLIEAEEKRLSEIQKQLFTKGAVEPAKRKELQFEAKQISNRINTYDRQLLNLESTTALKNVLNREKSLAMKRQKQKDTEALNRYKEKVAKTQRELLERHQESRKKATEGRNKTAMRHKIQSVVSELNTLLTHGNKKKHVPEDLKVAVAEVLELFNMDTVGAEERVAKYDALIAKAKDPDVIASLTETRDRIQTQGDKFNARLMKLKSAYDTIKSSADPEMAGGFDEVISSRIEYVASIVGKTPLRNMTLEQLEAVHDVYTMVLNNIREANTLFKKDKAETIENYASRVVGEVKQAGGEHEFTSPRTSKIKEFLWNNLKPIFAFEKIGSKTLTDLFEDVRKGEDTWAVDITDAKSFADSEYDKYNYKKWDFDKKYTFKSTTGEQFSLTLDQMLSLYAYSKRPQAGDHLRIGGFVFDDSITTYKEKENGKQSVLKYNVNIAKAHQISIDTLADIIGGLTNEQKAFVDEMQTYLSDVMGAKGNEVSMTLYNIRLFKEKNYFPLKSAKQFMFEQNEVAGEVKIKNSGFTESTVEHANNPIILNNFMDVWANHVNDMSMYHSFVVPLENFNRVFNYQTRRAEGMPPVSVKETLQNAYGTHAVSYIRQLLTDLNGGARSDPRESTAKKLLSTFKKAKVFTSASVVIQQPSAVARALAFIDAKYFDFNPKLIKHKERWEELKKYAPVAIIKEMGRFDTDMGLSTVEYIKDQKTLMQKAEDWLSKAPAYADELVWVHIWEAVKRETNAKHPDLKVGSEEFLKTAGERFTEVISKTQVYDSVLSKSANMRSKSGLMAMMTAFMAEPTTSINMVEQGLRLWKRGYKRLALKQLRGVGASIILNSALVSLVYAMRDDDEDETYLEKYLGSFVSETVDGFNPLTYFPIVKDVWSLLQGYDVERSDMSLFSDAIDSLSDITKTLASYDEDMTDEEAQKFKDDMVSSSLKLVDGVAALFGIPVGNIRRDINSIINTYKTVTNGASTSGTSLKNELTESVKDTTPVWGWLPDKQKSDKLYEAIMEKDTAYVDRLKSGYKDDKAYETALRKALRENDPRIKEAAEARFNGDFDEYERLFEEIENEGNFEFDTIKSAINTEFNKLDADDEETVEEDVDKVESIYSTSDMNAAFENGDTSSALEIIDDIVKVKTENYINEGEKEKDAEKKAKSSVKSSMTSYWKPLYIAAYNNKDNAEMARIRKILLSSGLYGRANDVIKTGQDWIKNSKK